MNNITILSNLLSKLIELKSDINTSKLLNEQINIRILEVYDQIKELSKTKYNV